MKCSANKWTSRNKGQMTLLWEVWQQTDLYLWAHMFMDGVVSLTILPMKKCW